LLSVALFGALFCGALLRAAASQPSTTDALDWRRLPAVSCTPCTFVAKETAERITMSVTPEQAASIEDCFMLFDKDSDGALTPSEFKTSVRALGSIGGFPTEADLDAYIQQSGGGNVTKAAFKSIMERRVTAFNQAGGVESFFAQTENPFKVLDMKSTGSVSASELKNVLITLADKLSEAEYDKLLQITGVTADGSGNLDYNELYSKMQTLLSSK